MNLLPNKRDAFPKPITDTRISASEWNQLVGSCMAFITEAGFTPDASDNEQFLNAFKAIAASLELIGANTNLSNLTATGEAKFNAKVDLDGSNATFPHIVETYDDGNGNGYRLWSDKWCEQYGYVTGTGAYGKTTVNLYKEFKDTYYTTSVAIRWGTGSYWYTSNSGALQSGVTDIAGPIADITTTSFSIQANSDHKWEAKGYIN